MENPFTEVIRKKLCDTLKLKEDEQIKDELKADLKKDEEFLENVNESLREGKLDDVRVGGKKLSTYFENTDDTKLVETALKGLQKELEPIICVNFSISASEGPMMIIRNLVGKLMSWCKDHQLFLNKAQPKGKYLKCRKDLVEFIDLFQDEGHRVAAYALWDAFTDLINGADIVFVEELAVEMRDMSAQDTRLKSNRITTEKYVDIHWSAEKVCDHIINELDKKLYKKEKPVQDQQPRRIGEDKLEQHRDKLEQNLKLFGFDGHLIRGSQNAKKNTDDGSEAKGSQKEHVSDLLRSCLPDIQDFEKISPDNQDSDDEIPLLQDSDDKIPLHRKAFLEGFNAFALARMDEAVDHIRQDIIAFEKKEKGGEDDEIITEKIKEKIKRCRMGRPDSETERLIRTFRFAWACYPLLKQLKHYCFWSLSLYDKDDAWDSLYEMVNYMPLFGKNKQSLLYKAKEIKKILKKFTFKALLEKEMDTNIVSDMEKISLCNDVFETWRLDENQGKRLQDQLMTSKVCNPEKFMKMCKLWTQKLKGQEDPFSNDIFDHVFGEGEKKDNPVTVACARWWRCVYSYPFWRSENFKAEKDIKFSFYKSDRPFNFTSTVQGNTSNGSDMCAMGMIYSARAKPKEFGDNPYQEIEEGAIVRLRHQYEEAADAEFYKEKGLTCYQQLTPRQYASKCTARVVKIDSFHQDRVVTLSDCSPLMSHELRKLHEWKKGKKDNNKKENNGNEDVHIEDGNPRKMYEVPMTMLQPVQSSRGKAGGMNNALAVLEEYIINKCKNTPGEEEKENDQSPAYRLLGQEHQEGTLLFAVFDARHMGQVGYHDFLDNYIPFSIHL